jgi:hypothetical protein
MGFLERARSTRGRHQRTRSTKVDESVPQSIPTQPKHSAKRKSIFPGLSSANTAEPTRPRAASARASFNQSTPFDKAAFREEIAQAPNTSHFTGNHSFKCPSPALVNSKTKRTPPTSVAHLPTMPDSTSSNFSPAPKSSSRVTPPTWNRSATDPVLSTMQRETLPKQVNTWEQSYDTLQRPPLRKQKSAWKTFGDLFRSKQSRQPIPDQFYQVHPPSNEALVQSRRTAQDKVGVLDSPVPSPVGKDERKVARVDSGRESLEPTREKGLNGILPPTPADSFPVRTSSKNAENFFDPAPNPEDETLIGPRRTPRLDISIPNAGFDRYSVMFEKLLEPKVPLLERRQSKRTSCQNGASPVTAALPSSAGLQRSMTTPTLKRMPSLTIHIANSNYAVRPSQAQSNYKGPVAHRPRPPKRSMTAPLTALSPPSVPSSSEDATPITARAVPLPESTTTASSPRCSILSENSLPPTPNTAVSLASSINTTIFGSPSSSPPIPCQASIAKRISTNNHGSSSASPPIPSRSEERPQLMRNLTGTERFNRQIVQVSVARQVSVSKARRRVADAVEVKQPLRPRVVELGKNRKSTLVMIESGDS